MLIGIVLARLGVHLPQLRRRRATRCSGAGGASSRSPAWSRRCCWAICVGAVAAGRRPGRAMARGWAQVHRALADAVPARGRSVRARALRVPRRRLPDRWRAGTPSPAARTSAAGPSAPAPSSACSPSARSRLLGTARLSCGWGCPRGPGPSPCTPSSPPWPWAPWPRSGGGATPWRARSRCCRSRSSSGDGAGPVPLPGAAGFHLPAPRRPSGRLARGPGRAGGGGIVLAPSLWALYRVFSGQRGDVRVYRRTEPRVSGCRWSTGPWPCPTEYDRRMASVR